MSEDNKKERFGRYLILDHLVDGGMAKICRARFLGEQADKVVAIKMVQPQFSKDESFKSMFIDEIKVTFGLLHPNIVQTYDYGLHNEQLYVAMEYCDGRNLKEYLDKLKEKKFVFPVEISVYIATQICTGLHYAHTYADKLTGEEANIIHRDISPHNIMLTYDGSIKVIDFGIAKAESNSESTQAGTIKGKLSYLAPEYLDGMELDHRYDQFAVGITLWEMLCSRKMFKAPNDLAVLKKIQECKIPKPSSINPNVPKELDAIVMKALSKDRTKRYENMDKFNRAMIKFLYANYPEFNASDLSYFAKELFKVEIKKDREKLFEFGKIDIRPYLEELKNEKNNSKGSSSDSSGSSTKEERRKESVLDFGFDNEESIKKISTRTKRKVSNTSGEIEVGTGSSLKMEASPVATISSGEGGRRGAKQYVEDTGTQTSINKSRSSKKNSCKTKSHTRRIKIQKKKKKGSLPAVAAMALLAIAGFMGKDLLFPKSVPIQVKALEDKQEQEELITPVMIEKLGNNKIFLKNFDKHQQRVYVNSKLVKVGIINDITVPFKEAFFLRIEKFGYRPFVKKLTISNDKGISLEVPTQRYGSFGFLKTSRPCIRGRIKFSLYGEERTVSLPIQNKFGVAFPLSGDGRTPASEDGSIKYEIYLQKAKEDIERKVNIKFSQIDEQIDLCEIL